MARRRPSSDAQESHSSRAVPVRVTSVPDGDSLWVVRTPSDVETALPVRLYGIDAPERDQRYGREAQEALWRLVWRTEGLRMEVVDVDRYHRLVVVLYRQSAGRESSINRTLIEQGHARWYREYGGAELGFAAAEELARNSRRGFWRQGPGVAPWDHRAAQRRASQRRAAQRRSWRGGCLPVVATLGLVALMAILLV